MHVYGHYVYTFNTVGNWLPLCKTKWLRINKTVLQGNERPRRADPWQDGGGTSAAGRVIGPAGTTTAGAGISQSVDET